MKDAVSSVNTLKKFTNEGWAGYAYVVRGGFAEFSSRFPDMINWRPSSETESSSK
jgi:protein-tyrosine phosphatase